MEISELGLRIAKTRLSKGLSAYELSLRINKDTSYMYKVEGGKVNVSFTVLNDICKALDIDIIELLS